MDAKGSVTEIIAASRCNPELLAELERFRRSIAVMFTDIQGSTSYFEKYGDIAGLVMVNNCNEKLREVVERHAGHVIKTIGDAIMATFEDCQGAVRAAVEMPKALEQFNQVKLQHERISIRIGLNYGSGIVKSHDVFGDVVNVASRVESAARPGQIVISGSVHRRIVDLTAFDVRYLGRYELKGKGGEYELFEVLWNEQQVANPSGGHVMLGAAQKAALVAAPFRLRHIHADGSEGHGHPLIRGSLSVGSGSVADLAYPGDSDLAPLHARFREENTLLFVEDLSGRDGVFLRLTGTHTLQTGDLVRFGGQLLEFQERSEALTAAAATGTSVMDLNQMMDEPVAEFVSMVGGTMVGARFPLLAQDVTWGRTRGTYQFPDDRLMSGSHARVYQRGADYFLEDLGSRNGTFVKLRGKTELQPGAVVRVGGQMLKVVQ